MVIIATSHQVKDYEVWRPFFDADSDRRAAAGIKGEHVFRQADEPNNVHIFFEVDDPSSLSQLNNDPELAAKMEEAGVISEPVFMLLNEA